MNMFSSGSQALSKNPTSLYLFRRGIKYADGLQLQSAFAFETGTSPAILEVKS